MSDTLAVHLFGDLTLERDGRDLPLPDRLHARLLLAYLALHPGRHARGDLADLLWPGVPADSGRSSLRSAVASVRRAVGELMLCPYCIGVWIAMKWSIRLSAWCKYHGVLMLRQSRPCSSVQPRRSVSRFAMMV